MFMVRGLFTSIKFPYVQFSAANTKGVDVFPLVRQAIKRLTCLGLIVTTITCDGASDNRRILQMLIRRLACLTKQSIFSVQKEKRCFSSLIHYIY